MSKIQCTNSHKNSTCTKCYYIFGGIVHKLFSSSLLLVNENTHAWCFRIGSYQNTQLAQLEINLNNFLMKRDIKKKLHHVGAAKIQSWKLVSHVKICKKNIATFLYNITRVRSGRHLYIRVRIPAATYILKHFRIPADTYVYITVRISADTTPADTYIIHLRTLT